MSKKFIDLDNLTRYDGKIKTYVDEKDYDSYLGEIDEYNSANTALDLNSLKLNKVYTFKTDYVNTFYITAKTIATSTQSASLTINGSLGFNTATIVLYKDVSTTSNQVVGYFMYYRAGKKYTPAIQINSAGILSFGVDNGIYEYISSSNVDQTVYGTKTFDKLPESSATPTTANQLVNKSYIDSKIEIVDNILNVSTGGQINLNNLKRLTHYKLKQNADNTSVTYDIKATLGSLGDFLATFYVAGQSNLPYLDIYITADLSTVTSTTVLGYITGVIGGVKIYKDIKYTGTNLQIVENTYNYIQEGSKLATLGTAQTISAKKTFSVLPESSVTPTSNNQLVNKKYVDDNSEANVIETVKVNGTALVPDVNKAVDVTVPTYTAGTGIDITNNVISATNSGGSSIIKIKEVGGSTLPSSGYSEGEKYYDGVSNKIYTYTNNAFDSGETPSDGCYFLENDNMSYDVYAGLYTLDELGYISTLVAAPIDGLQQLTTSDVYLDRLKSGTYIVNRSNYDDITFRYPYRYYTSGTGSYTYSSLTLRPGSIINVYRHNDNDFTSDSTASKYDQFTIYSPDGGAVTSKLNGISVYSSYKAFSWKTFDNRYVVGKIVTSNLGSQTINLYNLLCYGMGGYQTNADMWVSAVTYSASYTDYATNTSMTFTFDTGDLIQGNSGQYPNAALVHKINGKVYHIKFTSTKATVTDVTPLSATELCLGLFSEHVSSSTAIDVTNLKKGYRYFIDSNYSPASFEDNLYFKATINGTSYTSTVSPYPTIVSSIMEIIVDNEIPSTVSETTNFFKIYYTTTSGKKCYQFTFSSSGLSRTTVTANPSGSPYLSGDPTTTIGYEYHTPQLVGHLASTDSSSSTVKSYRLLNAAVNTCLGKITDFGTAANAIELSTLPKKCTLTIRADSASSNKIYMKNYFANATSGVYVTVENPSSDVYLCIDNESRFYSTGDVIGQIWWYSGNVKNIYTIATTSGSPYMSFTLSTINSGVMSSNVTSITGYSASATQFLTHDSSGNLSWTTITNGNEVSY